MTDQPSLFDLHGCDICRGAGVETDLETQLERRCRVCAGTGLLDYDPATVTADDPFAGLEEVT